MSGSSGRFRFPILLGSLMLLAAGFLPWWRAGGQLVEGVAIPASTGIGLDGPGTIIFVAAGIALVVLDIGYMRGRWGFLLDVPLMYLALGLAATGAIGVRAWELWSVGFLPIPQQSPGIAAAALGAGLLLYGAGRGFGVYRPG